MIRGNVLELWVGLFVAAGLTALAMLAFKVGNLTAADVSNGYHIKAAFDNIGGLKVKAPVSLAGVRIGRVSRIEMDKEHFRAVVEMYIDGQYNNLPSDSSASILTSGLLGDQYIGLDPGGAEDNLKDGNVIMTTASAVLLEKLVGEVIFSMKKSAEANGSGKK